MIRPANKHIYMLYAIDVKRLYNTKSVINGFGGLHHGSGLLSTHLDGSLLLMASDFMIWLLMAHMGPKTFKDGQYGS